MSAPRHFLDLADVPAATLRALVARAGEFRRYREKFRAGDLFRGRVLVMLFGKPSTRTRVSFEVAMAEGGGHAVVLDAASSQLGRGETHADTARVLSRYADVLMLRIGADETLREFARHATVPVINGLSDRSHPCQVLADLMTLGERFGTPEGRRVAWVGDGNNVAVSWIQASAPFGLRLALACPEGRRPPAEVLDAAAAAGAEVRLADFPADAVAGAEAVVTDTWESMGDESGGDPGETFRGYQVDGALLAKAAPEAVFLHCLPAHRGREVAAEVIDGPASLVWEEAENRLHVQKAVLEWCLGGGPAA